MRTLILAFLCLVTAQPVFAHVTANSGATNYPPHGEAEATASKMIKELPGYDESFKKEFAFDKPPFVGGVNGFPFSIYAWIHTRQPRLVDSLWYWDPVKAGKPEVDWNQFRAAYEDASQHLSAHSLWLTEWKRAERGRKLELHLFGTKIGESEFEMERCVLPDWKAARFRGQPGYSLLLRRPDDSWIHVLLGRDERRALVIESFVRPVNGRTPHWLDAFNVMFNPNGRRGEMDTYVVVLPSGEHELKTYPYARPAPAPTPLVPPSYGGGDGSSVDTAVIIHAPDEKTGVRMEYDYVRRHFPGFKFKAQSLFLQVGKHGFYDKIEFRHGNKGRAIYFQISARAGMR
jgi:hypothetical protein